MRGRKYLGAWIAALLLAITCVAGAEVVDRSIAVANGHLITWSDLDEQMRFEALENRRPLAKLTATDRREAFDHLVQNWILRDQMQGLPPAEASAVDTQIAELRSTLHLENDAQWAAALKSYGLTVAGFRKLVANQLEILSFLEFRIRPLVRVSREEIEQYYNEKLVPQVEAKGQTPEAEAKLRPQIRRLLREQKMNQEIEKWLEDLRSQAHVQVLWDGVQ